MKIRSILFLVLGLCFFGSSQVMGAEAYGQQVVMPGQADPSIIFTPAQGSSSALFSSQSRRNYMALMSEIAKDQDPKTVPGRIRELIPSDVETESETEGNSKRARKPLATLRRRDQALKLAADQVSYNEMIEEQTKIRGKQDAIPFVNAVIDKLDHELLYGAYPSHAARNRAHFLNRGAPTKWRGFQAQSWNWLDKFMRWYKENEDTFSAVAKLMFIATAASFVFKAAGGTEYVKRKVNQWFDRPTIYKVRSAKTIQDDKRKASGDQLVLSPSVQRSINEIVETLRWFNSKSKDKQREYKLRGVLFYGPPGTGKTSLARALAHRTGYDLIELMADDFNKIKSTADKIIVLEEMFETARKRGKTMIFLDELENLVMDRDKGASPLLPKMLELGERGDVFIIGATNRFFDVDPAFRRRLRYHVEVDSPTTRMRYQILNNYINWILRDKGFAFEADLGWAAKQLDGKAGGHIESLVERMRDRARLYGNTVIDEAGEERLVVDDNIVKEILIDMGILPPEPEEDVLDHDAIVRAQRAPIIEEHRDEVEAV